MWTFANKCFPIEPVPWPHGCGITWWQIIHIIPGLPVSSILQCTLHCHEYACLELFQVVGPYEPTVIEAHQAWKMICDVRSHKLVIKPTSFLEEFINCSNEIFNNCESTITVGITELDYPTQETAKCYIIVQYNSDAKILIPVLQVQNIRSVRHCMYICEVVYEDILKRLTA
jgi:hypothetical protein